MKRSAGGPPVPGLASRRIAAAAVAATLARTVPSLDEALAAAGGDDDALARAIAVATFRRFGTIRAALGSRLTKGLPEDPRLMALLATGAAQVLVLDTPDHAAVDLSVRLAAEHRATRHLGGLVNAVLRRLARERAAILNASPPPIDLPDWLAARWAGAYGGARRDRIAAAHRLGAALDLTCRQDTPGWAKRLDARLLPTGTLRLADRRPVPELPGYAEGAWWVQDAAAALPVRLLDPRPGERILDLCAAPGGKTAQLASAGARVTALDRSLARLERLHDNLTRLRMTAEIVCSDALLYAPATPFDAVLLDAPCTSTGTIRRHPDVAWTKSEADLVRMADLQARLLARAADFVRPGGRLLYCVCSLEPEEGEAQAAAFLDARPDFARVPIETAALGLPAEAATPEGDLRTTPDLWDPVPGPAAGAVSDGGASAATETRPGLDGFFAARFVRRMEEAPVAQDG